MSQRILEQIERVKNLSYTTLKLKDHKLYERYYPTFDRPDYTLIYKDLSDEEVNFARDNGIYE